MDLLTSIDQLFMFMNILTNFHITKEYLTLVTNYIKLVLLLSRVEDRKVVIGLYRKSFNFVISKLETASEWRPDFKRWKSYVYNTKNEYTETGFAHLSDFVQNFSDPIKRLSDEFSRNHLRTLEEAIKSLLTPYQRKSAYVDPQASFQSVSLIGHQTAFFWLADGLAYGFRKLFQWKNSDFLSLLSEHKNINQIHMSGQDMILCEIIPLEDLETWIYFGFILCYNKFSQGKSIIFMKIMIFHRCLGRLNWLFSVNEITAMWKRVMSFNFTLTLFRNETINVFKLAEETLDRQKSGAFSKSNPFHLIGQEMKVLKTSQSKNDYSRCRKESSTKCRNSSPWKTKLFTRGFERSFTHSRRWTGTYRTTSFISIWALILF